MFHLFIYFFLTAEGRREGAEFTEEIAHQSAENNHSLVCLKANHACFICLYFFNCTSTGSVEAAEFISTSSMEPTEEIVSQNAENDHSLMIWKANHACFICFYKTEY